MVPFLLVLSTIIELGGAALLVLGWQARWAALVIFLFVIPVTLVFHLFWADANQLWFFWKNVAIMGGILYIMAYGPGPFSMNQRQR